MTPIGFTHTQLTSTIALWASGHRPTLGKNAPPAAGPNFPLDWLDPIPRIFARVHRPELIRRLALRMRDAALNPIRMELMAGFRRIQILQTTVVEFGTEGVLNAYAWEMQPGARLVLQGRPLSFVSALGHRHEGRWCSGFAQGLMVELRRHNHQRRHLTQVQHLLPAYVLWVTSRLEANLTQTMEMPLIHQAIERALLSNPNAEGRSTARLGLDAAVLARAKERLRCSRRQGDLVPTLKDYQDCQPCLKNSA